MVEVWPEIAEWQWYDRIDCRDLSRLEIWNEDRGGRLAAFEFPLQGLQELPHFST